MPALLTTFSSIITEPKSLAPYFSAICPMSGPCVTHELWMFGMLSRKIRASACIRRYSAEPVGYSTFKTVCSGWNVQQMKAVNPPLSSC